MSFVALMQSVSFKDSFVAIVVIQWQRLDCSTQVQPGY